MRRLISAVITAAALLCSGCGNVITTEYANRLIGAEGQHLVLQDIEAIVGNPNITDDQKRSQLRGLGLEDEKLIEALLSL